jgi:collagenase-like PrtC family protease
MIICELPPWEIASIVHGILLLFYSGVCAVYNILIVPVPGHPCAWQTAEIAGD